MKTTKNIHPVNELDINDYRYELAHDRIAAYPLHERDQSRLLQFKEGLIEDKTFSNVPDLLRKDQLLVFNNTRVIRARLIFTKATGARIEVFLLEPFFPEEYAGSFASKDSCEWYCYVGNAKKWKVGKLDVAFNHRGKEHRFYAEKIGKKENEFIVRFSWPNTGLSFGECLELLGELPIPPYLNRKTEEQDLSTYQTVYAKAKGSVAAPTAGLHFTPEILNKLKNRGVQMAELTLHVGAGTFKPISSSNAYEHEMHAEHFIVDPELLNYLLSGKEIIAVGTTTTRSLESLYWLGIKCLKTEDQVVNFLDQWEWRDLPADVPVAEALRAILNYIEAENLGQFRATTRIMITPEYRPKVVRALFTNFHLPKSSLLLLVSAFVGEDWKRIYSHALKNNYRFLSYGDSSLLYSI